MDQENVRFGGHGVDVLLLQSAKQIIVRASCVDVNDGGASGSRGKQAKGEVAGGVSIRGIPFAVFCCQAVSLSVDFIIDRHRHLFVDRMTTKKAMQPDWRCSSEVIR